MKQIICSLLVLTSVSGNAALCQETDTLREQQAESQQRRARRSQPRIPPTHADVKYGPYERNVMDVWLARSSSEK